RTLLMTGLAVVASKFAGRTVKPDWGSEITFPFAIPASERMNALTPERTVPLAAFEPPVLDGNTRASTVRVASGLAGLLRSTRSIKPGALSAAPPAAAPDPVVIWPVVRKIVDPENTNPDVPPWPLSSTATRESDWLSTLLSMANMPASDAA